MKVVCPHAPVFKASLPVYKVRCITGITTDVVQALKHMDINEWDFIARLFEEALHLPIHERSGYLEKKCKGRPKLKEELLSLLSEYAAAEAFFREPLSFKRPRSGDVNDFIKPPDREKGDV